MSVGNQSRCQHRGFGGLSLLQTKLQVPQIEIWNTNNRWIFRQILECQDSLHKRKAPYLKPSGDISVDNERRQRITMQV